MIDKREHASDTAAVYTAAVYTAADTAAAPRKPYVRPRLTTYGNVREFTRGAGSGAPEKDGRIRTG
jgi:hypothetical protein